MWASKYQNLSSHAIFMLKVPTASINKSEGMVVYIPAIPKQQQHAPAQFFGRAGGGN